MERGRGELTMSERRAGSKKLQASSGLHTMQRTRRGRIVGATYSGQTTRLDSAEARASVRLHAWASALAAARGRGALGRCEQRRRARKGAGRDALAAA